MVRCITIQLLYNFSICGGVLEHTHMYLQLFYLCQNLELAYDILQLIFPEALVDNLLVYCNVHCEH